MNVESQNCDEAKENSLCCMARDFYNRKMLSVIIFTWVWSLIIVAAAVWAATRFFKVEEVKDLIMYAVIFLVCVTWLNLMKTWAWQMIHRNNIKRQIKRLEDRLAELSQIVKEK